MRNFFVVVALLFLHSQDVFSGNKQLKNNLPTAANPLKREPIKISLADFDADPFGYEVNANTLVVKFGKKFKVSKEIIFNTHNKKVRDTIFHFSYQTTKVKVYKSQDSEMVFSAQITANDIELRNKIRVGMSKDEFWQKFSDLERYKYQQGIIRIDGDDETNSYVLNIQPNYIKINNLMETSDYTFAFIDNKLVQVNINVYID
jgi:hypothetical protein